MQFFKYSFKFLLILLFLLSVGFVFSREYFLAKGVSQIEKSLSKLVSLGNSPQTYQKCSDLGSTLEAGSNALVTTQLRFVSDQEYVLETVCAGFEFSPSVVGKEKLPLGVVKAPGSSGFVLGDGAWAVSLLYKPEILAGIPLPEWIFARMKTVFLEDKRVVSHLTYTQEKYTPVTVCEGYGYECCDPMLGFGKGENRPASDCSDNCYQSCVDRPLVLSFSAQDFDQYSRQLRLSKGSQAQFFFALGKQGQEPVTVKLDFGDGQTWQGNSSQENANHVYNCQTSRCQYQAKIGLIDDNGVKSLESNSSVITVVVE